MKVLDWTETFGIYSKLILASVVPSIVPIITLYTTTYVFNNDMYMILSPHSLINCHLSIPNTNTSGLMHNPTTTTCGVSHSPHVIVFCVGSSINVSGRNFSMLLKTVVANPATS